MKFEEEFFSKDDLLDRGWSNSMINKFYGDPEFVIGKGSKKKMFKFYNKNKVLKIEKKQTLCHCYGKAASTKSRK